MGNGRGVAGVPANSLRFDGSGRLVSGLPSNRGQSSAVLGLGAAAVVGQKVAGAGDEETDAQVGEAGVGPRSARDTAGGEMAAAGDGPTTTDRRSALKKVAAGAAVAWTIPTVLTLTATAAVASGVAGCAGCGDPALVNPGAETGDLTGWTSSGVAGVLAWAVVNTVDPGGTGTWMFWVDGGSDISTTVPVTTACADTGAHSFLLGFIYAASDNATALTAAVEFYQGTTPLATSSVVLPATPNPSPPPDYMTAPGSLAGSIPAGADSAVIRFTAGDVDALIDLVTMSFC